jgi:hypothetical protein
MHYVHSEVILHGTLALELTAQAYVRLCEYLTWWRFELRKLLIRLQRTSKD